LGFSPVGKGHVLCYTKWDLGEVMAKKAWGGIWTEQKLEAFEKYVKAYLTIMNNNRDKFGWELIYFDAFAGSGSRKPEQKDENIAELFDITEEEKAVYRGAAERVVNIDLRGFNYYYFIESNESSKLELEQILNPIRVKKNLDLRFRFGDANEFLKKLAETMKSDTKFCSLAMIDPFGMEVDWESIEKFKGTKTDLWILIPSGVIINRLLYQSGKLPHIDKLVSFFGLSESEIKEFFYKKQTSKGLFDDEDEVQKVSKPFKKIAEVYIKQLKNIFDYVTPKPLVLLNSRNVPIYHFAFASNNKTASKIANDIIGRDTK
jgi:three-Cys-motif partner protein